MKRNTRWLVVGVSLAFVALCIACLVSSGVQGGMRRIMTGEDGTPSRTPNPTRTPSPTREPTGTPAPTATATSTPEPAWLSLNEFWQRYNGLTDLQKAQFRGDVVGQRVRWAVAVSEVLKNGTVIVTIEAFLQGVYIEGLPRDVAAGLSKGQAIVVEGTISRMTTFLGTSVYVNKARVL
jgi:hypothetical protein